MDYPHQKTASLAFNPTSIHEDLTVNGYDLRYQIDRRIATLMGCMTSLRQELDREINQFQEEGAEHVFNSLGIIQGRSTEIDRLCGEIATLKDILRSTGAWTESWRK